MIVANILTDIAGLSVVVVAVLLFILAIVFRREIKLALGRLTTLRAQRGETAVEATLDHQPDVPAIPPGQVEGLPDEPPTEDTATAINDETVEANARDGEKVDFDNSESVRRGMLLAILKGNEKEAIELRDRLREIEKDPHERVIDQGRWHLFRFTEGADASGLDQLQRLLGEAETPKTRVAIRRFRGIALVVLC
jgi:hypothetical protein